MNRSVFSYNVSTRYKERYNMKKRNGIIVYESLKEIVEPEHSCLVVWDVQNGLVDRIFNREEFMTNLKNFIEKLRGRMPVFYTLITPMHRDFRLNTEKRGLK